MIPLSASSEQDTSAPPYPAIREFRSIYRPVGQLVSRNPPARHPKDCGRVPRALPARQPVARAAPRPHSLERLEQLEVDLCLFVPEADVDPQVDTLIRIEREAEPRTACVLEISGAESRQAGRHIARAAKDGA